MIEQYIVAQNAFTISVTDRVAAWEAISPRFRKFAVASVEKPVLETDIQVMSFPEEKGEIIYNPGDAVVGVISARAYRLQDGCFVMEFYHATDHKTRVMMKMNPDFNRAGIILSPENKPEDGNFLAHALMIAFMLATCQNGTLLIHSSVVMYDGNAYLFQGKSGTGKSTHAALWLQNIPGAELLNDDNPVIRFSADGTAMVYGSPWSGKTPCYRNLCFPIGSFVRIVQSPENKMHRLTPLKAYASLTVSVSFLPFLSDRMREMRHVTIERLAVNIPCFEMQCRPDADAALTCRNKLLSLKTF